MLCKWNQNIRIVYRWYLNRHLFKAKEWKRTSPIDLINDVNLVMQISESSAENIADPASELFIKETVFVNLSPSQ